MKTKKERSWSFEKPSRKQTTIMLLSMLLIGITYLWFSGVFNINSSVADVFSTSSSKVIAQNDSWQLHVPEKTGLTPYFTYNGDKYPEKKLYFRAKVYTGAEENLKADKYDIYLFNDQHFFFGEKRWYFHKKNISEIFGLIIWKEYSLGEENLDYIISDGLTDRQILEDKEWLDKMTTDDEDRSIL